MSPEPYFSLSKGVTDMLLSTVTHRLTLGAFFGESLSDNATDMLCVL